MAESMTPFGAAAGAMGNLAAAGALSAGESSPEVAAQKMQFAKAMQRLRTGEGYGATKAQKAQERAEGSMQLSAQLAAQQAGLQRAQAGDMVSGGQVADIAKAQAGQAAAGTAQVARDVQARSNLLAQQQYAEDIGRIDAEAARRRQMAQQQAGLISGAAQQFAAAEVTPSGKQNGGGSPVYGTPATGGGV